MTLKPWADVSRIPSFVTGGRVVMKAFHGGSRVMCRPAPTDTDDDYVILLAVPLDAADKGLLQSNGFTLGGSDFLHTCEESVFSSWTKGDLNLIFTTDLGWYEKMLVATCLCMDFNIQDKDARIKVFQAVVYGRAP